MNTKVWLGLAGAAILTLAFWSGQLYERGNNAPAVAAATARTDALEGEKKSLKEALDVKGGLVASLQAKLTLAQKSHTEGKSTPVLLGVDPVWGPIVGEEYQGTADTETDAQGEATADAAATVEGHQGSDLVADRKASRRWYVGLGWQATAWDSLEGWQDGRVAAALGVNVQAFTLTARKAFDGSGRAEGELGYNF